MLPRNKIFAELPGPEAVLAWLEGSDHILHAGDICGPEVLERLARIAPLTAVRGNNDRGPWAQALEEAETVRFEGVAVHVVHDLNDLDLDSLSDRALSGAEGYIATLVGGELPFALTVKSVNAAR